MSSPPVVENGQNREREKRESGPEPGWPGGLRFHDSGAFPGPDKGENPPPGGKTAVCGLPARIRAYWKAGCSWDCPFRGYTRPARPAAPNGAAAKPALFLPGSSVWLATRNSRPGLRSGGTMWARPSTGCPSDEGQTAPDAPPGVFPAPLRDAGQQRRSRFVLEHFPRGDALGDALPGPRAENLIHWPNLAVMAPGPEPPIRHRHSHSEVHGVHDSHPPSWRPLPARVFGEQGEEEKEMPPGIGWRGFRPAFRPGLSKDVCRSGRWFDRLIMTGWENFAIAPPGGRAVASCLQETQSPITPAKAEMHTRQRQKNADEGLLP